MINPPWKVNLAPPRPCPYLEGRNFTQEYFFARGMGSDLWGELLNHGWRRFGEFFFRPRCEGCQACTPLRLKAPSLELSKSLKKVWNKNQDLEFQKEPLQPSSEIFDLYQNHSKNRFGEDSNYGQFMETFFSPGAPGFMTTYRLEGELIALGFLDESTQGLSSVYFIYGDRFQSRSLGTYSVLRECALAKEMGLSYYYLGYWVSGNARMEYKHRFRPRELYNWNDNFWCEDF